MLSSTIFYLYIHGYFVRVPKPVSGAASGIVVVVEGDGEGDGIAVGLGLMLATWALTTSRPAKPSTIATSEAKRNFFILILL